MFFGKIYFNKKELPAIENPDNGFEFEDLDEAIKNLTHSLEALVIDKGLVTTFGDICTVVEDKNTVQAIITYKPSLQFYVINTGFDIRRWLDINLPGRY